MLFEEISDKMNSLLRDRKSIKLLEAGCGSRSHFKFAPEVWSVGIDISKEQLDRNQVIQEKILGDLQSYPLPREEFDIVVCWDLVEHLSRPRDALRNMFQATKPDGFVILGFPNLASFKGLVTKFSPFWFHETFYRFMKYQSHPFRTYLRFAVLPERVMMFAQENGLQVVYHRLIEGDMTRHFRERLLLARALFALIDLAARIVSLGGIQSFHLDSCALILRKDAQAPRA